MKLKLLALAALVGSFAFAKDVPTVVLTFDDGLEEHYTIVAPILEKYGFRGTFNIITDKIGKQEKTKTGVQTMMTWDQVRDLLKRGHDIATHTAAHADLTWLSKRKMADKIKQQTAGSADKIEKETGYRPVMLCYPYNLHDDYTDKVAAEVGLIPMDVRRPNFGQGTVPNGPKGVGAYIRAKAAKGEKVIDILTHGVTKAGGGYRAFEKPADFEEHIKEIKAMVDAGEIKVDLYKNVSKPQTTK